MVCWRCNAKECELGPCYVTRRPGTTTVDGREADDIPPSFCPYECDEQPKKWKRVEGVADSLMDFIQCKEFLENLALEKEPDAQGKVAPDWIFDLMCRAQYDGYNSDYREFRKLISDFSDNEVFHTNEWIDDWNKALGKFKKKELADAAIRYGFVAGALYALIRGAHYDELNQDYDDE